MGVLTGFFPFHFFFFCFGLTSYQEVPPIELYIRCFETLSQGTAGQQLKAAGLSVVNTERPKRCCTASIWSDPGEVKAREHNSKSLCLSVRRASEPSRSLKSFVYASHSFVQSVGGRRMFFRTKERGGAGKSFSAKVTWITALL